MALQERPGALRLITSAVGRELVRLARAVGEEAINELRDSLVQDIVMGGRDALYGVRGTIRTFVRENGEAFGNQVTNVANDIEQRISRLWEENNEEWGNWLQENPGGVLDEATDRAMDEFNERQRTTSNELVPRTSENTMENTSAPARPPSAGPPQQEATVQRSGNPQSSVSKETPISRYPTLTYGLQETHTTILPWTGWLSVNNCDHGVPAQLKINMNTWVNMIDVAMLDAGVGLAKGFYNKPIKNDGTFSSSNFPAYFTNNATTTVEQPQWAKYWIELYQWYTVLGCEYKITINNPHSTRGQHLLIGTQMDTYSETATSTSNVMPLTQLKETLAFKGLQWDIVQCQSDAGDRRSYTVISGTYKPGQAKRNIVNDGDVKTWTSTGTPGTSTASAPNLKEILTLNFWKAPLSWESYACANIQIELKYIVQFKDLREQARYPNTATTDQDIIQVIDETQTNRGNPLMNWS